jgi:hypothetical protein
MLGREHELVGVGIQTTADLVLRIVGIYTDTQRQKKHEKHQPLLSRSGERERRKKE